MNKIKASSKNPFSKQESVSTRIHGRPEAYLQGQHERFSRIRAIVSRKQEPAPKVEKVDRMLNCQ